MAAFEKRWPATDRINTATTFEALATVEAGDHKSDGPVQAFPDLGIPISRRSSNNRRVSQYRQHRMSRSNSNETKAVQAASASLRRSAYDDDVVKQLYTGDQEKLLRPVVVEVPTKRTSGYRPVEKQDEKERPESRRVRSDPPPPPPPQTPPIFRTADLPPYPPSHGSWPPSSAAVPQANARIPDSTTDKRSDLLYYRKRFHVGKKTLFYTACHKYDRARPKKTVLNLAAVQRMGIHDLRRNITRKVGKMYRDGGITYSRTNEMLGDMHRYCQAIQDMEYIDKYEDHPPEKNPFVLVTTRALDCEALSDAEMIPKYMTLAGELPEALDKDDPQLLGMDRHSVHYKTSRKEILLRFASAAAGVMALIAPMIIMVLIPGRLTSLVTASVFALAFGVVIALISSLKPTEILGIVAAYTAVLVVFVGTGSPASIV